MRATAAVIAKFDAQALGEGFHRLQFVGVKGHQFGLQGQWQTGFQNPVNGTYNSGAKEPGRRVTCSNTGAVAP